MADQKQQSQAGGAAAAACCVFCFGSANFINSYGLAATPSFSCSLREQLDLARRRVHLDRLLARTLARTRVRARTLAPHRQALAMADSSIAA